MTLPAVYKTRCGIEVTLEEVINGLSEPRYPSYRGHFRLHCPCHKGIYIRLDYDKDLNEVNGEKGLDLVQRISSPDTMRN